MNLGIVTYDYDPPIGGLGIIAKMYTDSLHDIDTSLQTVVVSPSANADERVSGLASSRWKQSGGCPLFSLLLNFRIKHIVTRHALQLLHIHAGSGGVFLLRRPQCPTLVTAHHTYIQEAELLFHAQPLKRLWKYFLSLLERRTYRVADTITCVSKDTADILVNRYRIPREKIAVIENPIDDLFFNDVPAATRLTGSIVYVGRVEERKGITILLHAFADIVKSFPDSRLTLIGQNLTGDALASTLSTLGITHYVSCTGYMPQADRMNAMRTASIIVVPSILEGFGLVAAEAMSLGTPVIVSDCDGLRSLVEDTKTGLVFHTGSVESLQEKLTYALSHKDEMQRMALNAALVSRERFRRKARASELYNSLMATLQKTNK